MRKFFAIIMLFQIYGSQAQISKVSGTVKEYFSQSKIANANVRVKKVVAKVVNGSTMNDRIDYAATTTNDSGFYSLNLPRGEYVIEVSFVGYIKKTKFFELKKDLIVDLELSDQINQLEDLVVKAKSAESNVRDLDAGMVKVNIQGIKKMPIVFGEGDIIKAMTIQPGVTTVGEGAGGFNVRGGRVDQNLVLLDDAPLFNTSHLLGLFTSINAEAIQNASLYKGGVTARYGGRLSSLLNMTSKVGTETKKVLGIGPISSNLFVQQPFAKNKASFMLSARGAYPNWALRSLPRRFRNSRAAFYDLNAALQYRVGNKSTLKLTTYQTDDSFKFPEDTSYFWGSRLGTAQFSTLITSRLSFSVKGIFSNYKYGVNGLAEGFTYKFSSKNRHQELKSEFLYQTDKQKIEWGIGAIQYRFSPGQITPKEGSSVVPLRLLDENAIEMATFVNDEINLSDIVSVQIGLRYVNYINRGGFEVFNYTAGLPKTILNQTGSMVQPLGTKNSTYAGLEPRATFKVQLAENRSIKGSLGRMRQYMHLISNTTAISPVDYWKLSNAYIKPGTSDQVSLGLYQNFDENTFETYVEGFYKRMTDLVEYKDGAVLQLNPHLETELVAAEGKAYGAELSVQKNKGRLTGNLSYTWSRSLIKTTSDFDAEQINQGKFYASMYDKPHNVNVLGQYFLGNGWMASGNFTFQTGRPITYPDGQYLWDESLIQNYSVRNASRLPDFHRFDVSISKDSRRTKTQQKYSILNFSIYNVYARKNPYSIFFKQYLNVSKSYRLAVLGAAIPSLTLSFYR